MKASAHHKSRFALFLLAGFVVLALAGCSKEKKVAKVIITDHEFMIRQDSDHSFVIDAKGKVKNVGQVDVKNVVITGYCRSCSEILVNGQWFVSDVEKTKEQKAVIPYLPVGAEEDFQFTGVAFLMDQSGKKPEGLPEKLEIVIENFEPVEQ